MYYPASVSITGRPLSAFALPRDSFCTYGFRLRSHLPLLVPWRYPCVASVVCRVVSCRVVPCVLTVLLSDVLFPPESRPGAWHTHRAELRAGAFVTGVNESAWKSRPTPPAIPPLEPVPEVRPMCASGPPLLCLYGMWQCGTGSARVSCPGRPAARGPAATARCCLFAAHLPLLPTRCHQTPEEDVCSSGSYWRAVHAVESSTNLTSFASDCRVSLRNLKFGGNMFGPPSDWEVFLRVCRACDRYVAVRCLANVSGNWASSPAVPWSTWQCTLQRTWRRMHHFPRLPYAIALVLPQVHDSVGDAATG